MKYFARSLFLIALLAGCSFNQYQSDVAANQYLEKIWAITEQACSLLVFHGLMRMHIMGLTSRKMLTTQRTPLDTSTLYATGSGKLLLAFLPEQELLDYLSRTRFQRYTAVTITNPQKLEEELCKIRQAGYALDRDEFSNGVRCIAAPVQDSTLKVVGCIDVVFPSYNIAEEQIEQWIATVCQNATELSMQLRGIGLVVT
jgi:DNA-binding IclR family transcriptional regulator